MLSISIWRFFSGSVLLQSIQCWLLQFRYMSVYPPVCPSSYLYLMLLSRCSRYAFCGLNWASFIWAFWSCQHTDFTNPSCVGNRFWTLVWLASSEGKPHFKRATTRKRQAQKFELKTKQPPLNVLVFMRYFSKPYLCGGFFLVCAFNNLNYHIFLEKPKKMPFAVHNFHIRPFSYEVIIFLCSNEIACFFLAFFRRATISSDLSISIDRSTRYSKSVTGNCIKIEWNNNRKFRKQKTFSGF